MAPETRDTLDTAAASFVAPRIRDQRFSTGQITSSAIDQLSQLRLKPGVRIGARPRSCVAVRPPGEGTIAPVFSTGFRAQPRFTLRLSKRTGFPLYLSLSIETARTCFHFYPDKSLIIRGR